jgi:hypothetical protein
VHKTAECTPESATEDRPSENAVENVHASLQSEHSLLDLFQHFDQLL